MENYSNFLNSEEMDSDFTPTDGDSFLENLKNEDLNELTETNVTSENVQNEEKPKGRRGRPRKKEGTTPKSTKSSNKKELPIKEDHSVIGDDPKKIKINIDQLPINVIRTVYENFSKEPIDDLSKKIGISTKNIYKIIHKLDSMFILAITTGDLTQEQYDSVIAPNLKEFSKKTSYNELVDEIIKKI